MGPLGIFLFAVIVLCLFAVPAVERQIWEGLSGPFTVAPARGGHGRVVATATGPQKGEAALSRRLARAGAVAVGITVVLQLLALFAPSFALSGTLAPSLAAILSIAGLTALGQEEGSVWRSFGWALAGYVASDAAVTAIAMALGLADTALLNAIGMLTGAVGGALAVACLVPQRTYLRVFEDGTRSPVRVGANSLAARALDAKVDPSLDVAEGEFEGAFSHDFMRVVPREGKK